MKYVADQTLYCHIKEASVDKLCDETAHAKPGVHQNIFLELHKGQSKYTYSFPQAVTIAHNPRGVIAKSLMMSDHVIPQDF